MRSELVTFACLLIVILLLTPCHATLHVVDTAGGGDFETVQEALDAAAHEDSILIRAGEYLENASCTEKSLTLLGEGVGRTVVRAVTDAPAIHFGQIQTPPGYCELYDMTVVGAGITAIGSGERSLYFHGCDIQGRILAGGAIGLWDSSAESISASEHRVSFIVDSAVSGSASLSGSWEYGWGTWIFYYHVILTSNSDIGSMSLRGAFLESSGDRVGPVTGDERSGAQAIGSEIQSIEFAASRIDLEDCFVEGDVSMIGAVTEVDDWVGHMRLVRCLVGGDVIVDIEQNVTAYYGRLRLVHNTIQGDLTCDYEVFGTAVVWPNHIRSNIVLGETYVGEEWEPPWAVVTHNDFVGGSTVLAPGDSIFANITVDPLFCGSGDFSLQGCSPCVAAGHDAEAIGLYGVGCECFSVVESKSWGAIKAMYRGQPPN